MITSCVHPSDCINVGNSLWVIRQDIVNFIELSLTPFKIKFAYNSRELHIMLSLIFIFIKVSSRTLKVAFHLKKLFCGQECNGTETAIGMCLGHENRKIFCYELFRGKLKQVQPFLSFPCGKDVISLEQPLK